MTKIEKLIKDNIITSGSISLEEYMTMCLYHPEYGYYSKKNIIGKSGDFTTAPEISQVFGELIANWLIYNAPVFFQNKLNYLELGPGKGTLCRDILRTINIMNNGLNSKIEKVYFLEKSKELKLYQKLISKAELISDINQIKNQTTFIIANEFFDALPVNQYIKIGKNWHERRVVINQNNNLDFSINNKPVTIKLPFPKTNNEGTVFEYSRYTHLLLLDIYKLINNFGGVFLIIDYAQDNYVSTSTLSAIYKHKHVNAFFLPGQTDLSTKPNYSFFNTLAKENNCKVIGPFSQGYFLKELGIEQRIAQLIKCNPSSKDLLLSQKKRLIDKNYMGDIFKVLIITNNNIKDLVFENE